MARASRSSATVCLTLWMVLASRAWVPSFVVGNLATPARHSLVARASFESGKVNKGSEVKEGGAGGAPKPVIGCDEACIRAINGCLEDGCSVEAMMKLDAELAKDEAKIVDTMKSLEKKQKMEFSPEDQGTLAWLSNFLGRTGTLRAQLHAIKDHDDADFLKKIVKAASIAFGGGRAGDYPKVGVSPYTA
mmetsp:Transcript_62728/g.149654  ORF Transcript_62728/g.149654 Transcript_62728/m.149654 type:complete len:190 (+) Transcript_62728:100-669(+)|eukprot:CAMPEP_0178410724 /NCGR_PEP_ID=MMETSP0689_2-20121128/21131_1 /TAXON_ID=160604 /ORGANISM="Amphidinium massartii, Strain CS-259" /LENGTH=189 /DNA_ID=CAMNT_0020031917 /DNA_START=85 /DNA_END=654 /DNA_ORIENTATION=-